MEQLNSGVPVYSRSEAVRLKGKLNVEALEQALNAIVARHEILRSTMQVSGEQPVAVAHESWPLEFKTIDLCALSASEREAEAERLLVSESRRPYHLGSSPGLRTTLVRLGPQEHIFILMMHQILGDWSWEGVLWRELSALYGALIRGEAPNLVPLPIQHGDYAARQKQQLADGVIAEDLASWEENLRGAPELLKLPTDRPRPPGITYRSTRRRFRIGAALVQALRDCSRREKISLFTLFTAALDTLLYRYTGSDDILVGLPLADRDRLELHSAIGFPLQVHALRTRLSGDMSFRQLLARVQKGVSDLYSHRSPSFDQVVSRVRPERNLSYSPIVQVIINWRDRDQQLSFIGLDGLEVELLVAETGKSKFDLTLILTDNEDDISLEIEYNTDIFDDARIVRMVGHYQTLLQAIVNDPDRRLAELPVLTDAEQQQLLIDWNQTAVDYPKDRCVHELVEEQAAHTPESAAVVFKSTPLTYRQLNDRANQLAHYLQKLGVGPDTVVGICLERSLEMVIGLLGILKAGGAYLPLDPSYPKERLAFMVRDSSASVLLTYQRLCDQLQVENANCQILCLDADWGTIARSPTWNPISGVRPENLAYVIYTSGSTGEPKGVELMHGGLLNLIFWHRRIYQVRSADKATQLAGVGFDASVWELWPYLTAGASIHLPDEDTRQLPEKLRDWLVGHEITLSFVPTPLAEALVVLPWPAKARLRAMLTGGDRLTCRVPPSLPFPLINHYGPTESTVVTTCALVEIDRQDGKAPPIGKPIANTLVYLLDSHLHAVPIGVPGEVHIGGDGLARGYHNRPKLTAEKFIPNPFSGQPGARLYKTGDLARYLPTGTIEFLGRNDDQLKIRAFRIELGEIESVLVRHPGVRAAVVVASEDGLGEKRLVAYVTIHPSKPTVSELREHLKSQVPDYMVPWTIVILEQFPLTPNGKVDRAALPSPASDNTLREEAAAAPGTVIEKTVAGIVAALLGLDRVDAQANFFDLGGHSLLATQLIARVRDEFRINLPLLKVFESPTVADLSADIEEILVEEVEAMSEEEIQRSPDCLPDAQAGRIST